MNHRRQMWIRFVYLINQIKFTHLLNKSIFSNSNPFNLNLTKSNKQIITKTTTPPFS